MKNSGLLVAALTAAMLVGCAARRPLERFHGFRMLDAQPISFDSITARPAQVHAKISLRAPGLRGQAEGNIRHAKAGQYMVEMYRHGELFLKVYFTERQTVLWPAVGMPEFFAADDTPTLKQAVHESLPSWRLDDTLPVPLRTNIGVHSSWHESANGEIVAQTLDRPGLDPLWKEYRGKSGRTDLPFRKVTLYSESGKSRMTWSLRLSTKPTS